MGTLNDIRQGLTCCINWSMLKSWTPECATCAYRKSGTESCGDDMTPMLTAALDAVTPRLMTLEQVEDALDKPVWLEERGEKRVYPAIINSVSKTYRGVGLTLARVTVNRDYGTYGKTWRCWTGKPDKKLRSETEWNE